MCRLLCCCAAVCSVLRCAWLSLPDHAGTLALRWIVNRTILGGAGIPVGFWFAGLGLDTLRESRAKVLAVRARGACYVIRVTIGAETTALLAHRGYQRRLLRALLFKLVADAVVSLGWMCVFL